MEIFFHFSAAAREDKVKGDEKGRESRDIRVKASSSTPEARMTTRRLTQRVLLKPFGLRGSSSSVGTTERGKGLTAKSKGGTEHDDRSWRNEEEALMQKEQRQKEGGRNMGLRTGKESKRKGPGQGEERREGG